MAGSGDPGVCPSSDMQSACLPASAAFHWLSGHLGWPGLQSREAHAAVGTLPAKSYPRVLGHTCGPHVHVVPLSISVDTLTTGCVGPGPFRPRCSLLWTAVRCHGTGHHGRQPRGHAGPSAATARSGFGLDYSCGLLLHAILRSPHFMKCSFCRVGHHATAPADTLDSALLRPFLCWTALH